MLKAYIRFRAERLVEGEFGDEFDPRGFWAWYRGYRIARRLRGGDEAIAEVAIRALLARRGAFQGGAVRRLQADPRSVRASGVSDHPISLSFDSDGETTLIDISELGARYIVAALALHTNIFQLPKSIGN